MRVWDVAPGYLNRGSLLSEHREIHGIAPILAHGKRGYSRHPETLRWTRCEHELVQRHLLLVAEMRLRGYRHTSPMALRVSARRWPRAFVTEPADQFVLLGAKYRGPRERPDAAAANDARALAAAQVFGHGARPGAVSKPGTPGFRAPTPIGIS